MIRYLHTLQNDHRKSGNICHYTKFFNITDYIPNAVYYIPMTYLFLSLKVGTS